MSGGIFSPNNNLTAFGLDIGDRSLKVAYLKRFNKKVALESLGKINIAPDMVERGRIKDAAKLAAKTHELLASVEGRPIKTKLVVASLPEEESFVRMIQVMPDAAQDFAELVRKESESNIPVYLDEVYLDWKIVSQTGREHVDVIIAAVRREVVDSYIAFLKLAGLQPVGLEVESFGIARALFSEDKNRRGPILVVDLGAAKTTFIIYSNDSIRFTATINFESDSLTKALADSLNVSMEEAERLKIEFGLDPTRNDGKVVKALQSHLRSLVDQIEKHIDFYNSHPSHEHLSVGHIERLVLSGGGSGLLGLDEFLGAALNLPVEVGNPWVNIFAAPLNQVMAATYQKSLHYTTALGLALSGLNTSNR